MDVKDLLPVLLPEEDDGEVGPQLPGLLQRDGLWGEGGVCGVTDGVHRSTAIGDPCVQTPNEDLAPWSSPSRSTPGLRKKISPNQNPLPEKKGSKILTQFWSRVKVYYEGLQIFSGCSRQT